MDPSLTIEPEVGEIYEGTVATIKISGAFVTIMPGIDGMVHISQIADHRVEKSNELKKVKVK